MSEEIRVHKKTNYTVIDNDLLRDPTLSAKAKGVLFLLLSHDPQKFVIHKSNTHEFFKDGKDSIAAAFKELQKNGYIKKEVLKHNGKFIDVTWHVSDLPLFKQDRPKTEKPISEFPSSEKPISEKPNSEKPSLSNTNSKNTNSKNTNSKNTNSKYVRSVSNEIEKLLLSEKFDKAKELAETVTDEKQKKELRKIWRCLVGFVEWWNIYDRKEGKKKTLQQWKKLKDEQREKCKNVVFDYVRSTPDKKFRKMPSTYLNNESWNDEILKSERALRGSDFQF